MDMNWFRGAMTAVWLLIFLGVVWWAYSPRRKARFEEAAQLVFDDQPARDGKQTDSER
ncbi:cbb3-type cytochrome c oxidase subunit 3 [Permianibacter sp. IMCC34836]|uniref:cbb3-type cytochrome oxidase subunit 3 n=1 Tax=Permianibacter fluminis TaxID=2738515 RepID=UPI001552963C|nr:cbb3-type cytochrome c oxidase subunit 3 [Permianibacter fluminis]NQD37912.1 cbb3-type cytochrome c oxidase subunit 3 [Permianibacter fluminis]